MPLFKADMHIHTVLSPCGDLYMSPRNILLSAREKGIQIIAITDHNSTLMCKIIADIAPEYGVTVIPGVEITTREEAHCLAYFYNYSQVEQMQHFLEENLPFYPNDPGIFGDQVVVDADENIMAEIKPLLITGINASLEEIEKTVHEIGGIFIPAHIDRPKYSIISQLGFIPFDLTIDAIEVSRHTTPEDFAEKNKSNSHHTFVQNSDAHYVESIGDAYTVYQIENPTLEEISKALKGIENRRIETTRNLINR